MNPVTDIVFSLTWVLLFAFAIRSIVKGWSMMSEDTARPNGMWTTKVTRPMHPEMKDVKPGEELMVVQFTPDEDFKRKVLTSDSNLQQSLKERINEINDPWYDEDDDDDDDGDVPALIKR